MKAVTAIIVATCIAMLVTAILWSNRPGTPPVVAGSALGTSYRIHVRVNTRADRYALTTPKIAADTLNSIDATFSIWRTDSQIARFNAHAGDDWYEVSAECAALVAEAQRISELTDGAFDITIGPLVDLWGFGPAGRTPPPTDEQIAAARSLVGYQRLHVRLDPSALRKDDPAMRLDLSAIAKGHAVDAVHAKIGGSSPLRASMVEVGGEVRTRGENEPGRPWRIGIEAPTPGAPDARSVMHKVELTDKALATSGDYRNFVERDGRRLPHIIDPRTGRPVEHNLASVSVIADTCAEADALATALFVMGPDKARAFAGKHGMAVMLIERTASAPAPGSAGFATWTSPAWPK